MRVILISPVMMLSMYAAILGVMWFGGGFVARGELLPGELYAFFSYIVQVLMSVLMVGMCLLMLTRAVACARRVSEVLEARAAAGSNSRTSTSNTAPPAPATTCSTA